MHTDDADGRSRRHVRNGPAASAHAWSTALLTHLHSDHAGSAERAQAEASGSARLMLSRPAARTRAKTGRHLAAYLRRPAAVETVWELITGGGLRMPALGGYTQPERGDQPDVPGQPAVISLPGYSRGSIGFFMPDRGTCFSSDALVTLNLLTRRRPSCMAGPSPKTVSRQALASLDWLTGPAS